MTAPNFDREEILRTWHIFRQPGEVLELRIPEAGRYKTIRGYFDDPGKLADAVVGLADEPFPGIYFTVNPVNRDLQARAANRYAKYAKTTTSDADIIALRWLPIDLDAKRPAGISATDAEHEAAISKTWEIMHWLIDEQEWPAGAFVVADSGNGGHLNVKIDLENSPKNVAWVKGCLETLDFLFSDDSVEVDTTSGNPARIWKLYGTKVRKGDNLPERPHRLARILEVPETRETVTKEQLEILAAMLPQQEEAPKSYVSGQGFDPVSYCRAHSLQVHHTKSYQGGTLAVLEQCIFNPDHHLSACIIGWPSGVRTYRCRHHSCLAKRWSDAKAAIEGEGSRLEKNVHLLEEIHQEAQRAKGKAWARAQGEPGGDPGQKEDGKGKETAPILSLEEIEVGFKADPDTITRPESLAALRNLSPFKLAGFFKRLGITGDQKKILLDLLNDEESTREEPKEDPAILAEAEQILSAGNAFEYVLGVWQKRHHGDENLGKALLLSIGAQSCISSKGVHVHACGPRGLGKSDGTEKASEAIPPKYLLVGSASPKALYYLGARLPAGAVVYLDDIGWSDQAAQMFKTCTTFYRDGATHTVVVDQEIQQFKTAPRIIFWITTADAQTDEQVRDRLLRVDITEDPKHTQEVIDFIFKQRKSGAAAFDPHEIGVCRAIIHLLKRVFVDVVIPFADLIKFEGDPRGAAIFADLVSAFAIWRHRIRDHDKNGAMIAGYEDYKDAEAFFNAIKGHSDIKYTPSELRTLQAIKDLHGEATREMLMQKTGFSKGTLSDIMNGRSRDGQAKYGLLHKCPALTEEDEGTLKWVDKDTKTSRKRKIYRLPQDFDIMKSYGKAVYLGTDEITVRRLCSASSRKFADSSQGENGFSKDVVRKFVEYNIIRERRTTNEHHPLSPVKNFSFPLPFRAIFGELANLEPADVDSSLRTFGEPNPNSPIAGEVDGDSRPANHPIKKQRKAAEHEAQIGWLDDETDIVWLEDPHQYTYLREAIASSSRPDGPIVLNPDDDKTLIGYATVSPNDEEYYERRFWYLTKQDQDPAGIYSSGPAPSGAVDPKSISAGAPSIPWECPTVEPTPEGVEEIRFLARFRTPYKTEWPRGGGKYETVTYLEGEECVAPLERARQWKGRGVVDLVEIVLPWEPPEEASA